MPRLRYLKNYAPIGEEEDFNNENERISGNSWLSNTAIISTLSDQKIRTAIKALEAQISCLKAELLLRSHSSGFTYRKHSAESNGLCNQGTEENFGRNHRAKHNGVRRGGKQHRLETIIPVLAKLGVKDVRSLLEEWRKINERS